MPGERRIRLGFRTGPPFGCRCGGRLDGARVSRKVTDKLLGDNTHPACSKVNGCGAPLCLWHEEEGVEGSGS
jgi:hypothetical protein